MNQPIRMLHLEDNKTDAELVRAVLEADGFACTIVRVEKREDFESAIERDVFDVVLADFSLPQFNGITALTIARKKRPGVPFIFVSGEMVEELAAVALTAGATDYVEKQRLDRLPAALRLALRGTE